MMSVLRYISVICLWVLCTHSGNAQSKHLNWISFEQLEDSLSVKPKKVFIDFYASWCAYCKKMDRAAFSDHKIIEELNTHYYAVRMDAESTDSIAFGGKTFVNRQYGVSRNPIHEIPLLMGKREGVEFSLPLIIILDENFEISERYFEYISPKEMKAILKI